MAGSSRGRHDFNGGQNYDVAGQVAEFFAPDQPVPDVFTSTDSPERRLMRAVLEDAISTLQAHAASRVEKQRQRAAECATWFASRDLSWPYSFEAICGVLDIDPEWIRSALPTIASLPRRYRSTDSAAETQRGNRNGKGRPRARIVPLEAAA